MAFYIFSSLDESTISYNSAFFNGCILIFLFQNRTAFLHGSCDNSGWKGPQEASFWFNVLPEAGSAMGSGQVSQSFNQSWKLTSTETSESLCATVKMLSLMSSLNLSFLNFCLLSLILPPCTSVESLSPSSWWPPKCHGASRSLLTPQRCLFSQAEWASILHPLHAWQVQPYRQTPTVSVSFHWTHPGLKHWQIFRYKITSANCLQQK